MRPDDIIQSFELAAERCADLTPLVYEKLFARFPEMLPLFVRDRTGAVRGEMLARTIDTIFDYLEGDHYATNLIRTEIVTHEGYGVPPEIFARFFETLAATMKDLLADDWSAAMAQSWEELLVALSATPAADLAK